MYRLFLLITLSSTLILSQDTGYGITLVSETESVVYNGSALIRVDDELLEFKIGNTVIPFTPKAGRSNVYSFPQLKIGRDDKIIIKGSNLNDVYLTENPAGILASITYYDGGNKITILSSQYTWNCDGDTMNVAPNDGYIFPVAPEFPTSAINIWSFNYKKEVTCTYDPKNLYAFDYSSKFGSAFLNVDSELLEFKIGNRPISFKQVGGDSNYVYFFQQIRILLTDSISISVKNWNWEKNAGSILASIRYVNSAGQWVSINTSKDWTCNGLGAFSMFSNGNSNAPIKNIDSNALRIWNQSLSQTCTCVYDPDRKVNARLTARVDDELLEFWVNGEKKDFYKQGNNWMANYVIDFYYQTGWSIVLVGKNQLAGFSENNPASIVASINYVEKDGTNKRINTDTSSWKCNGKSPMNLGANVQGKWWFEVKNVDTKAMNIWPSDNGQIANCVYSP